MRSNTAAFCGVLSNLVLHFLAFTHACAVGAFELNALADDDYFSMVQSGYRFDDCMPY